MSNKIKEILRELAEMETKAEEEAHRPLTPDEWYQQQREDDFQRSAEEARAMTDEELISACRLLEDDHERSITNGGHGLGDDPMYLEYRGEATRRGLKWINITP